MLWRRCSNVEATSWQRWRATLSQRRKLTSIQLSFSTVPQRCDNVNNDVVTTLSQRCCASWVRVNRQILRVDRRVLRVDRQVLRKDKRMDRRVLRVDKRVLRMDKQVLRVLRVVRRLLWVVRRVLQVLRMTRWYLR